MNQQADLFYEGFHQALGDDIKAVGGLKRVGKMFFPEKDTEAAGGAPWRTGSIPIAVSG